MTANKWHLLDLTTGGGACGRKNVALITGSDPAEFLARIASDRCSGCEGRARGRLAAMRAAERKAGAPRPEGGGDTRRQTPLRELSDLDWLRETHVPGLPKNAAFAILYGNEDAPQRVEAWPETNPFDTTPPAYIWLPWCEVITGRGQYRAGRGKLATAWHDTESGALVEFNSLTGFDSDTGRETRPEG